MPSCLVARLSTIALGKRPERIELLLLTRLPPAVAPRTPAAGLVGVNAPPGTGLIPAVPEKELLKFWAPKKTRSPEILTSTSPTVTTPFSLLTTVVPGTRKPMPLSSLVMY